MSEQIKGSCWTETANGCVPLASADARAENKARARAENKAPTPAEIEGATRPKPLPDDAAGRKEVPMGTGFIDYFPDAIAAAANVSFKGNQQHNPGQPLHWARGKSMDHADCIVRHFTQRGTVDIDGVRHSAKLLWRAAALLQQELEEAYGLPLPRGCKE